MKASNSGAGHFFAAQQPGSSEPAVARRDPEGSQSGVAPAVFPQHEELAEKMSRIYRGFE